jgi:hypothetical protein
MHLDDVSSILPHQLLQTRIERDAHGIGLVASCTQGPQPPFNILSRPSHNWNILSVNLSQGVHAIHEGFESMMANGLLFLGLMEISS